MPTTPSRRSLGGKPRHRRTTGRSQAVYPTFHLDASLGATSVTVGPASYARHIGRIGALAVALGVGAAVATSHGAGVARADEGSDSSSAGTASDSSSSDPSRDSTPTSPSSAGLAGSEEASPNPSSPPGTSSGPRPTVPDMNFSNTGGAHTSGVDDKPTAKPDEDEGAESAKPSEATPTTPVVDPPSPTTEGLAVQRDPTRRSRPPAPSTPRIVAEPAPEPAPASHLQVVAPPTDRGVVGELDLAPTSLQDEVTPESPQPEPDAPAQPTSAPSIAATLIGAVIAPLVMPGPAGPTQSPLLWAMLAWTRRESQRDVVTQTALDETATAARDIEPPTSEPVAYNDIYTTIMNTPVSGDVLLNDYVDPNGGSLTVVSHTQPPNGTVVMNAQGHFDYTPDTGYLGPDEFTYTVYDESGASATGIVSIAVLAINHPPVAVDDEYEVENDRTLSGFVMFNDSDPEGELIFVDSYTQPTHGTVSLAPDSTFVYTPVAGFIGIDTFTYTIYDVRRLASTATVTINVVASTSAPHANADYAQTPVNTPVRINVLANDSDPNGEPLTAQLHTPPGSGIVTTDGDGTFTYTPDTDFFGDASFTYEITNARGYTAIGTVMVTVVNNVPIAGGDVYSIRQGSVLEVDAGHGVLANDLDLDGDAMTVASFGQPRNGTVVGSPDGAFVYTPAEGFFGKDEFAYVVTDSLGATATTTVSVEVLEVLNLPPTARDDVYVIDQNSSITIDVTANDTDPENRPLTVQILSQPRSGVVTVNSDGSFDYAPTTGFLGVDTFRYQLSDGVHTDEATVTITVVVGNQPPITNDDAVTVPWGEQVIIAVLQNDTDPDGDDLYVSDYGTPQHGTTGGARGGAIEYTPDADFFGTDKFTYTVTDGFGHTSTATVTVTILPPNQGPTANDDVVKTQMDTPLVIDVLANDVDPDGDRLLVEIDTPPDHGKVTVRKDGSLEYTPPPGYVGTDYLNYTVTDPSGRISYATVTIIVTGKDDGGDPQEPDGKWYTIAQDRTLTVPVKQGILAGVPEFYGWSVGVAEKPAHGTLQLKADGSFAYTPDKGFVGRDTFVYYTYTSEIGDGPFTVTIDVTPLTGTEDVANTGGGLPECSDSWLPEENAPGAVWPPCLYPEARKPSDLL